MVSCRINNIRDSLSKVVYFLLLASIVRDVIITSLHNIGNSREVRKT